MPDKPADDLPLPKPVDPDTTKPVEPVKPKAAPAPAPEPAPPEPPKPKFPPTSERLAALEQAAGIRYDADPDAA